MDYYENIHHHVYNFLAFMNKWAIDGNGTSFLQVNISNDIEISDTIPDSGNYDYDNVVHFIFSCTNTADSTNGEIVDWFALVGEFDITKIEFISFTPNNKLWDDQTMYYSTTEMNEDAAGSK